MKSNECILWEASQIVNEYGDEIEIEIIQFRNQYHVTVNICQERPPFKDFTAIGIDLHSKRKAAKKALIKLYNQAYPQLFKH
ncbi:hypothetical protein [Neobacillus terrae]|uniref:hypothetical protein n=1 Tax=Neobacillus terrae TaxID=3034837 RepID=UPI00140AB2FA|nr:hypothetical protein [Neobacillus terrae]NHM30675.1 hypothetical protein [Neobacillus terrae]